CSPVLPFPPSPELLIEDPARAHLNPRPAYLFNDVQNPPHPLEATAPGPEPPS
ncbi:unnamed protein product, partial [marine sediment metagenome]